MAIRIFVSSTWEDLEPERKAIENYLHKMQNTDFVGMEHFGSRPDTPRAVSLREVNHSNIYIGILAHRYGSGITEEEYRRAREVDIPCLIYFKDEEEPVKPKYVDTDPVKKAKLDALKSEIQSGNENLTISFFKNPDQLAAMVVTDLQPFLNLTVAVKSEKRYCCYVDVSGQHADSRHFIVAAIILEQHCCYALGNKLESMERTTGKGVRKWRNTHVSRKKHYLSLLREIPELKDGIFFMSFEEAERYEELTSELLIKAIERKTTAEYQISISIDGLRKRERRAVSKSLSSKELKWKGLQGEQNQSSAILRLADAVVGLIKDRNDNRPYTIECFDLISHCFVELE